MTDEKVNIGGVYRHFKWGRYGVIDIARDCENPERRLVVYKSLDKDNPKYGPNQTWVRELSDFLGEKTLEDGTKVKRFTRV